MHMGKALGGGGGAEMMMRHKHRRESWEGIVGQAQAGDTAQLTLLFPLALLLLTGLAVQLGLLQGPVEFFGSLLLLEANLFFSSPPLFFLFPLQNY